MRIHSSVAPLSCNGARLLLTYGCWRHLVCCVRVAWSAGWLSSALVINGCRLALLSPALRLNLIVRSSVAAWKMQSEGWCSTAADDDEDSSPWSRFAPKKVLILSKLTRLDFEQRKLDQRIGEQDCGISKGTADLKRLRNQHNIHYTYLKRLCHELSLRNVECRVVQRWDYNPEAIDWADAVVSAGGDGTYLLAASKIRERDKPLIGINTDPTSSEGYLCLMKKRSEEHLPEALDRLFAGEFKWMWRQRIRVTLTGKNAHTDPVELYHQQLMYPEYRWSEHVREYEDVRLRTHPSMSRIASPDVQEIAEEKVTDSSKCCERALPYLALNDVFIGESLSSRVSYYDLQIDDGNFHKQKSSGLTVCTGTGSTSWYFNINKLTDTCVRDLLTITSEEMGAKLPYGDNSVVCRICKRFNEKLIFSPEDSRMAYVVRDPVFNATFQQFPPRGFSRKVVIRSRGFDSHLVIDGGMSYIFNHGTIAKLEINPQDAIRTIVFR